MVAAFRRSVILLLALSWMGLVVRNRFGFSERTRESLAAGQSGSPETQVAGQTTETKVEATDRPLPDIPTLMRAVEANQKEAEAIEKNYMYRSAQSQQELDGHGRVKKTETREYEVFWMNGVPVHRLIKRDGKELSPSEQKKENDKLDKDAAKAKERRDKANEKGKETDPRGNQLITVSRLLELGSFTNARRVQLNGRDTIAVDFVGDPKAKTRSRAEDVIRDLAGTAWVDETDRMLVKAQGHFLNSFKIGGGLVANIQKGTSFSMEQRKVNDEVWLPAMIDGQGAARALLVFSFNGKIHAAEWDYRKFKATSTILPGMSTVEPDTNPR
jgi:hypothetical protein